MGILSLPPPGEGGSGLPLTDEGKQSSLSGEALSVSFADSSPRGGAKRVCGSALMWHVSAGEGFYSQLQLCV